MGFETSQGRERTFNLYDKLDDIHANGLHDYLKYLKFGFSRATDIACNLIRRNLLTREDASILVKKNDGLFPRSYMGKSLEKILSEYDIKIEEFNEICDDYTNFEIFKQNKEGELLKRDDGSPILNTEFNKFSD